MADAGPPTLPTPQAPPIPQAPLTPQLPAQPVQLSVHPNQHVPTQPI